MASLDIYTIYRLFGAGMNYYGSTKQPLYERKAKHNGEYKNKGICCSSKIVLEACEESGEDWNIEIVEELDPNLTKEEVLSREKWWIQNNECVNKNSPIQTAEELKEYKRQWAEKDRREKGVPVKEKIKTLDINAYKREKQAEYRENMTEEEKETHLKHRRETRPELTEEEKEKAKERARKQREKIKADPEKAQKQREYKRKKEAEYRAKKALEND